MLFLSLKYWVMRTVFKPVLVYDRDMQMHLPHCVTNLHSYLLKGISIYQILCLISASFKGAFILSPTFRMYHAPKVQTVQRKVRRHHFSTNLTFKLHLHIKICKFVTFCHKWSRNFLLPRFFISCSINIRAELFPSIHFGWVSYIPRWVFCPWSCSFFYLF